MVADPRINQESLPRRVRSANVRGFILEDQETCQLESMATRPIEIVPPEAWLAFVAEGELRASKGEDEFDLAGVLAELLGDGAGGMAGVGEGVDLAGQGIEAEGVGGSPGRIGEGLGGGLRCGL